MPSSSSSQKPSWLADLLDKDAADIPTPPSSAGEDSAPTDWSKNVTVGKGTLAAPGPRRLPPENRGRGADRTRLLDHP